MCALGICYVLLKFTLMIHLRTWHGLFHAQIFKSIVRAKETLLTTFNPPPPPQKEHLCTHDGVLSYLCVQYNTPTHSYNEKYGEETLAP